ncbi:MAG: fibronectin type III domain-containing protein, partial [Eubacterium sp.]|nr:fibronectin type III domain-containing protein [Eubacterium sp.]
VFDVSGNINLSERLKISASNLTILGQTAPGEGICIGGEGVYVTGSQIIMRYLRFRMGDNSTSQEDALGGKNTSDIILDRCSISWSEDEDLSFYAVK